MKSPVIAFEPAIHFFWQPPTAIDGLPAAVPLVLAHHLRQNWTHLLEAIHLLPPVSCQVSLELKMLHGSFLLFSSGCLFSSGLVCGMGKMMVDQTTAPPIVALYLVHFIQSILQLFYSEPNASPGGLMLPNLGPLRSNLIIYQTTMKNIEFSETTDNSTKPDPSLDDDQKEKMHKHLGLDIREMMSSLTNHLGSLLQVQKVAGGSSHHGRDQEDTDHEGVRIITLAGNNVGATMRGEMDDQKTTLDAGPTPMGDQPEALNTYVNSNFQAINNSIMMDGCYSTNDPGVHMDISDYMVPEPSADTMHGKKGKKKHKGSSSSESDHHAKHSE
ncbi:hypothetical protein ACH5RR_024607 [Cinchona calisaya]|uniref:Uncharacterized protein n=1 Tax=Cinchona calisaya TaxID=153742 RepID=A0ABD2Z0K7_9GENT